MSRKGGEIEVGAAGGEASASIRSNQGVNMGGTGAKNNPSDQETGAPVKPPLPPIEDDDSEDGDIATPKRDRSGDDDEPL
jgi:hypothetical protein